MEYTAGLRRSVKGPGLIRRVVGGKHRGKHSGFRPQASAPDIIDLGAPSEELALARIERLERGTRLLAETMKLTYGRMTAAIEDLRLQAARAASLDEVQRLVAVTLRRLRRDVAVPGPSDGRVLPVLPLEVERAEEAQDALTALRRARFAGREADGS